VPRTLRRERGTSWMNGLSQLKITGSATGFRSLPLTLTPHLSPLASLIPMNIVTSNQAGKNRCCAGIHGYSRVHRPGRRGLRARRTVEIHSSAGAFLAPPHTTHARRFRCACGIGGSGRSMRRFSRAAKARARLARVLFGGQLPEAVAPRNTRESRWAAGTRRRPLR